MNCKVAKQYIHLHLDGELTVFEYEALQEHIGQCEECKLQYDQLEKVDAMAHFSLHSSYIRQERKPEEVNQLTNKIMKNLPKRAHTKTKKRFVAWIYRYPGLTAAALFIFVMVASVLASWDQDTRLVISASEHDLQYVQIQGNTIIVPEGAELTGDLVVENGIVEVKGAVGGDVTVIDGKMVLASTGHIAGQSKTIDQALDWFWYKMISSFSDVIPR